MNTANFIRIAFFIALVQYFTHAFLFLTAKPLHGQEEATLIDYMKSHKWSFNGFNRSYWDFYFGYGLISILLGLAEIALLWQTYNYAKIVSFEVRPLIVILFFTNIIHAILTVRYFFLLPAIFDFAVSIILALAFIFKK